MTNLLILIVTKHIKLELGDKYFHLSGNSSRFQNVLSKPEFIFFFILCINKRNNQLKVRSAIPKLTVSTHLFLKTTLLLAPLTIYMTSLIVKKLSSLKVLLHSK